MAKVKVSLDLAKVKSFFVSHVEKIVFGVCALLLLLFLYKSISLTPYEREPKEISDKASEKERMLQQASWSPDRIQQENLTLPDLNAEIAESRVAVPADKYGIAPFNEPLFETRIKRAAPKLLAAEKPEVSADLAAFVVMPPAATVDVNAVAGVPGGLEPALPEGGRFGGGGKGGKGGGGEGLAPSIPGVPGGPGGPGRMGRRPFGDRVDGPPMMAQAGAPLDMGFPVNTGQKRVAMPFAVVKMLVPAKKQREIYRDAFLKSVFPDPSKDEPRYRGFIVERQEVGGAGDKEAPWEKILQTPWTKIAESLAKKNQAFAGYANELAPPETVHPALTHPLGPKTESGWEMAKVVHSELVPQISEVVTLELQATGEVSTGEEAPKEGADDPFGAPDAGGAQPGGGVFRPGSRGGMGGGGMGKGGGRTEVFVAQAQGGEFRGNWQGGAAGQPEAEFYLLRFFDFNVEPGKSYRYRVQLGLTNPNFEVDAKYLDDPAQAKKPVLTTDWSEPTAVVSVPRESYMLVGDASRGSAGSEPSLNLLAVKMISELGIKAAVKQPAQYRGQIGNWRNEKVDLPTPENEPIPAPVPGSDDKPGAKPKKPRDKPIDLITDTLLVDIRGGEAVGRGSKAPAEVLVMTPSGRLAVRSQVTDSAEYLLQEQKLDEAKKRKEKGDELPAEGFRPGGKAGGGKG